jgi:signal transduction histidine kinase
MAVAAAAARVEERSSAPWAAIASAAGVGVAATGLTYWAVERSSVLVDPTGTAVLRALFVASYTAVGLYTWIRTPARRLGPLVTGVGLFFALVSFEASPRPWLFAFGRLALAALVVFMAYVFLCFPRDGLDLPIERRVVAALSLSTVCVWAIVLPVANKLPAGGAFSDCGTNCPPNAFQLSGASTGATRAVNLVANSVTGIALFAVIILIARKALAADRLRRRALTPLLGSVILLAASYVTYSLLREAQPSAHLAVLRPLQAVAFLAIPTMLLIGQIRARVFAAASLGQLVSHTAVERVAPRELEKLIRDALGDPTLELGIWKDGPGRYVDGDGKALELPHGSSRRAVIRFDRGGEPAIALAYNSSLQADLDLVRGLGSAALVLLDNQRLVDELRASRARLIDTEERERRRLERDLHDGAQQRLMAIQVKLALARDDVSDETLATKLDEVAANATLAAEELRELAHGIYPTVLIEQGLADALRSYALAAPIPVRLVADDLERCSSSIETAVYFCSLEAVQNAAKHGGADVRVVVTLSSRDDTLAFDIHDDGVGFALAASGTGMGLASMRDRIGAVGGRLHIDSSPGQGTSVRGSVPISG